MLTRFAISLIIAGAAAVGAAVGAGINLLTDRFTFDEKGYNALGYDRDGYDRLGFDRDGFNGLGYNASGYDRRGFDAQGYNVAGRDRSRLTRGDYAGKLKTAEEVSAQAGKLLGLGEPDRAHDAVRVGLADGVKIVIAHKLRESYAGESLQRDIEICRTYRLLDGAFLDRLAEAQSAPPETADVNARFEAAAAARQTLDELLILARGVTGTLDMLEEGEENADA